MARTHRSMFLKDVKEAFPEIVSDINAQYGLLHCEMHEFHFFVQGLINDSNKGLVAKAFQIADYHFKNGNSDLVNAIGVSFLEHLELESENNRWAFDILPPSLREPYKSLRAARGRT